MNDSRDLRASSVADLLNAIKTLDEAAGSDDRFFRQRLRLWVQTEHQLAERKAQAEVAESRF